ncbi:MAG: hypothetical protein IJN21_10495, partial [Clostridia bacterium]|nr:hypothetical protein [Clostridia bacterium]
RAIARIKTTNEIHLITRRKVMVNSTPSIFRSPTDERILSLLYVIIDQTSIENGENISKIFKF